MKELQDRILKDGQVIGTNILKVNKFINHQVDPVLMEHIGEDFANHFAGKGITKVVTIESSGIAPALMAAAKMNVPLVILKKQPSKTLHNDLYQTQVTSFTTEKSYELTLSRDVISEDDNILLIDDFMADGEAATGAIRLLRMAHATVAGIGILIEKSFQPGRRKINEQGYEVYTVGDDIAWMKPGKDGRLYAINPENGFFGVAPGTNAKSNYNALASTMKNTIFTNVALNNADNTVWWEGLDKNPPVDATEWKGAKVNGPEFTSEIDPATGKNKKLAHPNSRFTAPAVNCPCVSPEFNNPDGVPVSAIIFGGRRASTTPLVYQSFDWVHGTYMGSAVSSETTAAATGAVGVLRHDPMAMKPFIGYNVGDYWAHWLEMGEKLGDKAPKIFNVNWFKQDEEGHFMWPGFGDNMRVLDWIIKRCEGTIDAEETAIGYLPKKGDINLEGIEDEVTPEILDKLLYVDKDLWKKEIAEMRRYYKEDISDKGGHIPAALIAQLDKLEERLNK